MGGLAPRERLDNIESTPYVVFVALNIIINSKVLTDRLDMVFQFTLHVEVISQRQAMPFCTEPSLDQLRSFS